MPGVSGYVSRNAPIVGPGELVRKFEEVHALNNVHLVHRVFQSDHCVISNLLTGLIPSTLDQPASDPGGNTLLFLEGQIFNADELAGRLHSQWASTVSEVLLALFLEQRKDCVSLLNGEFNLIIYEKKEQRLTLLNDRLASKPLYYMEERDGFLFGSEKKAILALVNSPVSLDPVALIQLFAYSHHVAGKTLIESLYCLPPASCLEYQMGRLKVTKAESMPLQTRNITLRIDPLIEEWGFLLKRATNRRLNEAGRVVISLSGGLDSRALACAIPREYRPLAARTRGDANSSEVRIATDIARRLSIDHFREEPRDSELATILPKIVWRTECAIPFTNAMTLSNHRVIKQHGDFMAGGWFAGVSSGSMLSEFMFLPYSRGKFIDKFHQWYMRPYQNALPLVFTKECLDTCWSQLRDVFFDSFGPLTNAANWQAYEIWNANERQARMTFCAGPVDSHLFEYIRPFLDADYIQFVLSLPAQLRYGQTLYQAMIYRIGPEIRDVPNANTELMLKGTLSANLLDRVKVRMAKLERKLRVKVNKHQDKAPSAVPEDFAAAFRQDTRLRSLIEGFLNSESFDSSIFNKMGILHMLEQHYCGMADYTHAISMLATLAVGLPYFVHKPTRRCPPEAEPLS